MRERIQSILSNLRSLEEDLLTLSDDIWLSIDHNDSESVKRGAEFKVEFNASVSEFTRVADQLSQLVEDFTEVPTFQAPAAPESRAERERRERFIKSLDERVPHSLDEDFRYKRPVAFSLVGVPFDGTATWSQVYETVCRHLALKNSLVFDDLPANSDFVSNRGNKYFSRKAGDLRVPRDFGRGVLAETNLSANQIRDNIKRMLRAFGIAEKELVVYLGQDRDAVSE